MGSMLSSTPRRSGMFLSIATAAASAAAVAFFALAAPSAASAPVSKVAPVKAKSVKAAVPVTLSSAKAQTAPPPAASSAAAPPLKPGDFFDWNGAIDLRDRDTDKEPTGSYIAAARLTGNWTRIDPKSGTTWGGARLQFYLETDGPRDTATNHLRLSDAYVYYDFTLPGVSARVRAGQFALPFGLTAIYDPLQPIQPLYEKALGLRTDLGLMLEGQYGPYLYFASVTTGAGPNRVDPDGDRVITVRLERTVLTKKLGTFIVGGSLLSGRGPMTSFNTRLPASGTTGIGQFVDKTRFAGDGQYFLGPITLRGEVIFGGDGPDAVWGYFAEGNYAVTPRLTVVAMRRLWNFPEEPQAASTVGVGLNYNFGRGFTVRSLYEFQRDVPLPAGTPPDVVKRIILQTRLSF